jgi:hypothetical protein
MRRLSRVLSTLAALVLVQASTVSAQTVFVNGLRIPGNTLDATNQPGANGGRFGFFSDIYYDPTLNQWWALSDRGPGGGLITYDTRLTRFQINTNLIPLPAGYQLLPGVLHSFRAPPAALAGYVEPNRHTGNQDED